MSARTWLWLGMGGVLGLVPAQAVAATLWAAPAGISTAAGTQTAPLDLKTGLSRLVPGDSLLLASGTYAVPYVAAAKNTLTLSAKGTQAAPIVVRCPTGRAVIDFGFPEGTFVQDSYGFLMSGSWWSLERLDVTRAGYQGTYVTGSYNTFDNCRFYSNRNSGVEVNKGGSYTTLRNVDSYNNYDPKKTGSMADGFAIKQTMGPGNKLIGCRAWNNSDDGYDTYDSPEFVTFDSCWAFRNGWYHGDVNSSLNNTTMNGNGFKVGGLARVQKNVLKNCVAVGNKARGFDQNSNTGGVTILNSTSYKNGTQNYSFAATLAAGEKNVFTNNISLATGSADQIANATSTTNTWNSISVAASDFQSVDTALVIPARKDDGSIPTNAFLRLKTGSKLIDAGTATGLAYQGGKPDLGAFESNVGGTTGLGGKASGSLRFGQEAAGLRARFELDQAASVRLRLFAADGALLSEREQSLPAGAQSLLLPIPVSGIAVAVLERDGRPWSRQTIAQP